MTPAERLVLESAREWADIQVAPYSESNLARGIFMLAQLGVNARALRKEDRETGAVTVPRIPHGGA